jgi:DNA-binding LytR/AlgR family response regulator
MTTRRKTSTSGFSSEKEISEVIYITEPSTPEELESEVETAAQFVEAAEEEIVEEVKVEEKKEEPPAKKAEKPTPVPVFQTPPIRSDNPPPNTPSVTRHRRNIPRFIKP